MAIAFQKNFSSVVCQFSNKGDFQINETIDLEVIQNNHLEFDLTVFLLSKQNFPLFGKLTSNSNGLMFSLDKIMENEVALSLLAKSKNVEQLLLKSSKDLSKMKNDEFYQMINHFISDVFNGKKGKSVEDFWFVKKETYDEISNKVDPVSKQTFGHLFTRNLNSIKEYIQKLEKQDNTFPSFNCVELNVFKKSITPILSFGLERHYNNLTKMVNKNAFDGGFEILFLGNKKQTIDLIHHFKGLIEFLSQDKFLGEYVNFDINTIEHSPFYKDVDLYSILMKNKDYQAISNFIQNNHFMKFLNFNFKLSNI